MGEPEIPEMHIGTIAGLWRYPVKSLAAEALKQVAVEPDGIAGDRRTALIVASRGHARSGKPFRGKEHRLLHTVTSPGDARAFAAESAAEIELAAPARYFDAEPVSLLWDTWLRDVEELVGRRLDPLRYRPNIFVRATASFTAREGELVGKTIAVGQALLLVVSPIGRCVTTTYDIASGDSDPAVLREVAQRRANVVGVYCRVERSGSVARGDLVAER